MKIDLFTEMQSPRPWSEDHEHRIIMNTLEQAKLADRLGYGCWWQVEHHTAEEFSYSSAPEVMLAAISQHTTSMRLGHASVLSPFRFNHPIRVAERAAMLDHLSGGRLELGLARSTIPEWRTFNIPPDRTRDQMQQAFEMIPKMWTQERFSWKSEDAEINNVPIIPKPYQKPHPPLWQACSSLASFEQAGRNGVGALGVTLWAPPDQVKEWIGIYREAIRRCERPVGAFINNQVGFFTFAHCAETDQQAMENGAASAAAWYTNGSFTFFEAKEHFLRTHAEEQALAKDPAGGGLVGQLLRDRAGKTPAETKANAVLARIMQNEDVPNEEVFDALKEQNSLIVGSPETCRQKIKFYQDLGIDRLLSFQQVGRLSHEQVMSSIRQIGKLIPEFE
ncbi:MULTISPECIES: LLM class flavin-dependent oxidoreductase [Sorangium]|uniref:LLM class flavin-dependent oxidoreductase n=1 Tax=Sorangium atrum TaxID=2995308 RepID=A0ABT5BSB7_9BACT|nr:LLM class flavin-dependent oxidoreductase [Sorangium aterium]MDC0676992.1 LLM class flavin-dependent oxidoreductase [Sorangium aterium]